MQFIQASELCKQESIVGPMELIAGQFYEAVKPEDVMEQQRLIILPLNNPATWASLVKGNMAVPAVKVGLPGIGGGLVLWFFFIKKELN